MQTHTRVIYLYADDNKKYGMHTLKLLLGLAPLDERKFSGCSPHPENVLCTRGLMDEMPDASQRRALCYELAVDFRVQGHDALVRHEGPHLLIAHQTCLEALNDPALALISRHLDQHRRPRDAHLFVFREYLF